MEDKKVSIIVPVYNAEQYLAKCIDSLRAQTYQNLEILLIDDGSTDGSAKIVDQYASADQRIRVFHKQNGGLGSSHNFGLDHMTGDYVTFVDDDDWVEKEYISLLVSKLQADQLDYSSCAGFDYYEASDKKVFIGSRESRIFDSAAAVRDILDKHQFTMEALTKKLYRAEVFQNIRLRSDRNYQDTQIFFRIVSNCRKMGYYAVPLYNYLVRKGSITHSGYKRYSIQQVYAYEENLDLVRSRYPQSLPMLKHNILSVSMSNYMRLVIENKKEQYPEDVRYYQTNFKKYRPMLNGEKSKTFLYGCWLLYKWNPRLLDREILKHREMIASIVNADYHV